jgi:hypothetical protein
LLLESLKGEIASDFTTFRAAAGGVSERILLARDRKLKPEDLPEIDQAIGRYPVNPLINPLK